MQISFPAARWPPVAARGGQPSDCAVGETTAGLGAWGRLLPARPGHDGDGIRSMHVRTLLRRGRRDAKSLQRNRHAAPWSIATPHATGFISPVFIVSMKDGTRRHSGGG